MWEGVGYVGLVGAGVDWTYVGGVSLSTDFVLIICHLCICTNLLSKYVHTTYVHIRMYVHIMCVWTYVCNTVL